ncbi:hypothetical protein EES46_19665 [Streptomyces sp. ADI98-10]|nr:hypothetical protein EES46_19665 [Streptomyces sp. ADI98-10]
MDACADHGLVAGVGGGEVAKAGGEAALGVKASSAMASSRAAPSVLRRASRKFSVAPDVHDPRITGASVRPWSGPARRR